MYCNCMLVAIFRVLTNARSKLNRANIILGTMFSFNVPVVSYSRIDALVSMNQCLIANRSIYVNYVTYFRWRRIGTDAYSASCQLPDA